MQKWYLQVDFVKYDGDFNYKDQFGKEVQCVGGDMWCDIGFEE